MNDTAVPPPGTLLMHEVTANVEALLDHTLEHIQKPPAGSIAEVGHFRLLNGIKRKEQDALEQLLEDFAFNVAATVLAMLDGKVEGEGTLLPTVRVTVDNEDVTGTLYERFSKSWSGEEP